MENVLGEWRREENDMKFYSAPLLSKALIPIINSFCSTLNVNSGILFDCLFLHCSKKEPPLTSWPHSS